MTSQTRSSLALLAIVAACNSTSGSLVPSLPVEVGGAAEADGSLSFTTGYFGASGCGHSAVGDACGWQVTLDEAVIAVGPFYFYQSPPSTQGGESGTVLMQITSQFFVDALDPRLYPVPSSANGESGPIQSAQIYLYPPGCSSDGPNDPNGGDVCGSDPTPQLTYANLIAQNLPASLSGVFFDGMPLPIYLLSEPGLLNGSSAFVAGSASETLADDGGLVTVPFYGFITIDQSTGGNGNDQAAAPLTSLQQVAGACPCAEGCQGGTCSLDITSQTAALQIRVDPSHWFDGVDFSKLIPTPSCGEDGGAPADCAAGAWWLADAGALTWNSLGADSYFNTELVEEGLQLANGVYLFSLAPGAVK